MKKEKKKETKEKKQEEEKLEIDTNAKAKDFETKSKSKIPEKSELEQEVEEQEIPSSSRFKQFLQTKSSPPILERVTQGLGEVVSLEKGMEINSTAGKKEERQYQEAVKYDTESKYQAGIKRQREITPDMASQIAPIQSINMERIGRERIRPGHEFHMRISAGMPEAPASEKEYDLIEVKKSKRFEGETTAFQENLERRYER